MSLNNNNYVIDKEIEHFEKNCNEWWDEGGVWEVLHTYNSVRVPMVITGMKKTGKIKSDSLKGVKILDVGCGAGILSEALAKAGAEVVGIDPAQKLILAAEDHLEITMKTNPDLKVTFMCDLIQDHVTKFEGQYDAVIASEVVEHIPDVDFFLRYCVKAVKPGGSVFVTTLNRTFRSWFFGWLWAERILNILPTGTHSWFNFQKPCDIVDILNKYDCHESRIEGFLYFPIIKKFISCSDTAINYGLQAVKNN